MLAKKLLLQAGTALLLGASLAPGLAAQTGDIKQVHDPAIIKQGDTYYLFSTGDGIPIRRSKDLIRWERAGRVFPKALPDWAEREVPGTKNPWAPDISFFNGKYHLYYSISTGGGQRSVIGLATNRSLDPSSPNYKWEDQGKVVESFPGVSTFNAIDPNVAFDERRQPWLNWGSFWGGIKLRKLDPTTGMLSKEDTTFYNLAARAGLDATEGPIHTQSIEGPFIIRRGDYYYLFASYDMCCRGARSSYNIRVGRSEEITGIYKDEHDVRMTHGGGTVILGSIGRVRGPGHHSILTEGENQYLVHHYYDAEENGVYKLQIRPLIWKEDGWPVVGDPLTPPN